MQRPPIQMRSSKFDFKIKFSNKKNISPSECRLDTKMFSEHCSPNIVRFLKPEILFFVEMYNNLKIHFADNRVVQTSDLSRCIHCSSIKIN